MTGSVIMVDWPRALLYAAGFFLPLAVLLHLGHAAGGWVGDRAGRAVATRIRHRRRRGWIG